MEIILLNLRNDISGLKTKLIRPAIIDSTTLLQLKAT